MRAKRTAAFLFRRTLPALGLILTAGAFLGAAMRQDRPATPERPMALAAEFGNLEGEWRFRTDPDGIGEQQGWQSPDFDDSAWRSLRVPGYWEPQGVTETRPGVPPKTLPGVRWTDYDGVAWYRLRFVIPAEWSGKTLCLSLGSVDDADRTFLNGVLVGETPITRPQAVQVRRLYRLPPEAVRPGRENVLAVRVTDGGGPGGIMGPDVTLGPEEMFAAPVRLPGDDRPLADRFRNPPASTRILKIIHGWPDDPESQDSLIRSLASQGFGGVVCNVSFTEYLRSEPRWEAFVRAVREAKKAGMTLWLYDEKGYPSGTAGGLTLEGHPEWQARGLLVADAVTEGRPVELTLPPGELVLCAAYPYRPAGSLDLSRAVSIKPADRTVRWTPPSGRWHVMAITEDRLFEGTHAANSLGDRIPYINMLLPEPTDRFLELTHAEYARRLGNDLGAYFVSTFTDEPSLMSFFWSRMPYKVLPWSQTFASEYRRMRGTEVLSDLPHLVAGTGRDAMRARYRFWKTVADLTAANFFGRIQTWCRKHNIRSGGHLLLEENLSHHVPLYGDFLACIRRLDAPSIDCLTSVPAEVPWHIARMMGSVADLEGCTETMCETSDFVQTYRPAGDTRPPRIVTEAEIRGTCNRLMLGGIHTITSYYTFQDLSARQLRRLNEYVGRCVTLLKGGCQWTDVAVVYPVESAWVRFRPSRHMTAEAVEANQVERVFRDVSDSLLLNRWDFTYLDSRAIAASKVEKGALVHGKLRWRVVVLPMADTLPMAAWKKLDAFVQSGGVLIAVGALPANSETAFPSPSVQQMARRLFGQGDGLRFTPAGSGGLAVFLPAGARHFLPQALERILEPAVQVEPSAPIRAARRRSGGHDVFFLINDSDRPWEGTVRLCASGPGERWDPMTGQRVSVADPSSVQVSLEPYAGIFYRFRSGRETRRMPVSRVSGPVLERRPLVPSGHAHGAGQYVQASVTEAGSGTGRSWRAVGTLLKSSVDTFLFPILRYEPPVDLSREHFLVFRVEAPRGQPTAPSLLVIVTDSRGVQYYAETGRSLALPGRDEIVVPLARFVQASFSTGPRGEFDWSAVTAISLGWGGHFGEEGDRIEFTMDTPLAARLRR